MSQFNQGLMYALQNPQQQRQAFNARGQVQQDGSVTSEVNGNQPMQGRNGNRNLPPEQRYGNPIAPGVYDPNGYSQWPVSPNAQNPGPTTGAGPNSIARPGEVPDSWASYRRDKDGNIIQTGRDKTFGQWFGDFSGFGDAAPLVQWQMDQWQASRDASLQNRENAIKTILERELGTGSGSANDPFTAMIKGNIQNLLDNPNLIDQAQEQKLNDVILDRRLKMLDGQLMGERDRAAGMGLSNSGISRENMARYVNEAGSDTSQQMQDLKLQLAQAARDSRLQGLGIGADLTKQDQALYQDRTNALANIMASTELAPPDISGLLSLGLGGKNYNQALKGNSLGRQALGGLFNLGGQALGTGLGNGLGNLIGGRE